MKVTQLISAASLKKKGCLAEAFGSRPPASGLDQVVALCLLKAKFRGDVPAFVEELCYKNVNLGEHPTMRALLNSLFALALWQHTPALAQTNSPMPSAETSSQARQLVQSAEAAYQSGDFSSALEDYSLSYTLTQDAQLLFFIAQCQQQLRSYQEAIQSYRDFLVKTPVPLSDEQRQEVESLILEAEELDKQQKPTPKILNVAPDTEPNEATLFWAKRPVRTYAPFFAVSGLSLISAAVAVAFSVQSANNVKEISTSELLTSEQLRRGRSLSLLLAVGADVLVLTSAITGTLGVLKWRDQKRELSAKVSTDALWIQLRY
jgi:tetratricopeptide (TPR) repeat protein